MQVEPTLRIGTFLAPNMLPVYHAVAEYIGRQLNRPAELVVGTSFEQFDTGELDVGFICGLPYVELARQHPPSIELLAAPVLAGERYTGRPIYFSDVIVRRDSPLQSFDDLRGRRWAYNDRWSHSGYNVVRYHLAQIGERRGYFSQVVEAGWHQRAVRLVHSGAVAGAAVDSQVLAVELRDHPELADGLRTVATLGPSTIQPVVAARRLPSSVKQAIQAALLAMAEDPDARLGLAHGYVDRFVVVADADYDDIRAMTARAQEVVL